MIARAGLVAIALILGCRPFEPDPCPEARERFDGQCCAPWSTADVDVCVLTSFATPTAQDSIGAAGARDPEVVLDADGRAVIAWTQAAGSVTAVTLAQELEDGSFSQYGPGATLIGDGSGPSLASDDTGRVLLSWRQQLGEIGGVHYAERGPGGAWTFPPATQQLSFGPTAYEPRSVYADNGETLVVYNQWTGEHFGVAVAQRAPGLTGPLSRPANNLDVLSPPVFFSNAPIPAVAANGDAVITWYQSTGSELLTFVSERFGTEGEFSRPTVDTFISVPGGAIDSHEESNPAPAIHDRGDVAIVWTQENGAGHIPVYLAWRDGWCREQADGCRPEWHTPAGLDDSFSTPGGAARCPRIAFAGEGTLYVTWFEEDPGGRRRVLVARRNPQGEWVEDGRAPTQLSSPDGEAVHPALAVGPEGHALVAYPERTGDRWDLVVRRKNPGDAEWLPAEVLSAALPGDASDPFVSYRDGQFVVAWVHGPATSERVHLARVTAAELVAPP